MESDPLWLLESGFMHIKTKAGSIIQLKLNYAQKRLLSLIKEIQSQGKPVRIVVLKARQLGISTVSEAIIYAYTSQREGINSLILSDDKDGSNYLLEMVKLYHERNEKHTKPREKKSNEKKLEFDQIHSQIIIETANNERAGRKYTYQYAHLSEVAFFPENKTSSMMGGLLQTVPDLPSTIVIAESTANGVGNYFHELWDKATSGKNEWTPLFISWCENPEYEADAPKDFNLTDEEKEYKIDVKSKNGWDLSNNKMYWRRLVIRNKLNGDTELFKQEHPAYPEQAFLVSGRLRFDKHTLITLRSKQRNPIRKEGNWEIFYDVLPDRTYILAADTAEGLEKGDNSVAQILDPIENKVVAKYRGKIEPASLGHELIIWGNKYNTATIAVEQNNHGLTTLSVLKEKNYPNMYYRKTYDEESKKWTKQLGWYTSSSTKPYLIDNLAIALLDGLSVESKETIDELFTFVVNRDGTTTAVEGKNDDEVMSLAIANQVRIEGDFAKIIPEKKAPKHSVAWYEEQEAIKSNDWRSKY